MREKKKMLENETKLKFYLKCMRIKVIHKIISTIFVII